MSIIWQIMPSMAFKKGLFDGIITIGELKKHGSFGLGEFEALDGELIVWNGEFYRATADGAVHKADDSERLCLAFVSDFQPKQQVKAGPGLTNRTIPDVLRRLVKTRNSFIALTIHGNFEAVSTTVFRALPKPYPSFADASKSPQVFNFSNVRGRLVAYYTPPYMGDIGVTGFHFHYLADGLTGGGHVTSFALAEGTIVFEEIDQFCLQIPTSQDFRTTNLD